MKGVIYVRVSTMEQDYDRQVEDLKRYADSNGIEVVEILEEKESGFNDDRAEFQKLLSYTKADIDIILVWELTRLSRNSIKLQSTVRGFVDKGIKIYAYKDGFTTHNADGSVSEMANMVLAMMATMAESEAKTLKLRTMAGRFHSIVVNGNSYTTKELYGYKIVNGVLYIDEAQAENVRKAYQMCLEGYGMVQIAYYLKSVDKTHIWSTSALQNLLHNPTYKGKRTYTSKCGKTAEITTPAIVSEEVWDKAQEACKVRKSVRSKAAERKTPDYILKGLVVCSRCGRRYSHSVHSYICVSNINPGYDRCGATNVSRTNLDEIVWTLISEMYSNTISSTSLAKQQAPLEAEIKRLQEQVVVIEAEKNKLHNEDKKLLTTIIKLMDDGNTTLANTAYDSIRANDAKEKKLEGDINNAKKAIEIAQSKLDAIAAGSTYTITDATEKSEFTHRVIDCIKVYGSRSIKALQIFFKAGTEIDLMYYNKKWYSFPNDGCISFTDGAQLKQLVPTLENVDDVWFEITNNNNSLFTDGEMGKFSADEFLPILQKYNLARLHIDTTSTRWDKYKQQD